MGLAVGGIAGIAVDGQGELDRHLYTCAVGQIARAPCQIVGHAGTSVDVVAIVVLTVFRTVDGIGHAGPLGIVT